MATPTQDLNMGTEASALVTDQFKQAQVLNALLNAYVAKVQELENAIFSVINTRLLQNNPVGDQLNQLGAIVGEPRNGRDDTDYLAAVKLRIRVNRSQGLAEDVIQVAALSQPGTPVAYYESGTANFMVEMWDLATPATLAELLSQTRSAGTYGNLIYTTWPDGSDIEFTSTYGGAAGELNLDSTYGGATGGLLVAAEAI